jgi:hypothetical protein
MDYLSAFALALTVVGTVWGHAIWLSGRFTGISKEFDIKFEKFLQTIMDKLEYHERHDDQRFGHINDSIWEMRLQNALNIHGPSQEAPRKPRTTREEISGGSQP